MPAVDPTKYPKAKYHATDPSRLVANPDEEKELGPDWFDHPDLVRQQRAMLEKRLAGRPKPSREAFEQMGAPMLDEK